MSNSPDTPAIDDAQRTAIEAAVYRAMVAHLRKHPEVQNIDLMNLAFFCRNCLSKWYRRAAAEHGVEMDYEQARAIVYGMPYADYKSQHAQPASDEQLKRFERARLKASE